MTVNRSEIAVMFITAISDRFTVLKNLMGPAALCDFFKRETPIAAQESISERPRTRQNFNSLETLEATDSCQMARLDDSWYLHHSLVRRAQTLLSRGILLAQFLVNDLRPVYQALRKLNSQMSAVHSLGGLIISDHDAGRERIM